VRWFYEVMYRHVTAPWERMIPLFERPFAEGEIAELFGDHFRIETIERHLDRTTCPPGNVTYLLTRV